MAMTSYYTDTLCPLQDKVLTTIDNSKLISKSSVMIY